MCAEIRRVAAKGCRAVTMPELPHLEGLPSYHDDEYWGPVFRTLSEENVVMCLHIGTGFGAISMAPNAPIDNLIILATQVSAMCAQDLLWGPAMRNYPDLKFAFSEGGIGWIPFYLDRSDRHYTNQKWLRRDFGDKLPSDVFREHSLACYVTDKTSLKLRHEIGIDIIAWECDYPHSDCFWPDAPEQVLAELNAAGADDTDINKITWQNSCRFFGWDPFARTPREQATVAALRAKATDVDVSIRPAQGMGAALRAEAARQGVKSLGVDDDGQFVAVALDPHTRLAGDGGHLGRVVGFGPAADERARQPALVCLVEMTDHRAVAVGVFGDHVDAYRGGQPAQRRIGARPQVDHQFLCRDIGQHRFQRRTPARCQRRLPGELRRRGQPVCGYRIVGAHQPEQRRTDREPGVCAGKSLCRGGIRHRGRRTARRCTG